MPEPKYALNHEEVDQRFPRTSDKQRRCTKLQEMIRNDNQRLNQLNLKLATHKLELKILSELITQSSKFQFTVKA